MQNETSTTTLHFHSLRMITRNESSEAILVAFIVASPPNRAARRAPPKLHSRRSRNFHTKQNDRPAVGVFSRARPRYLPRDSSRRGEASAPERLPVPYTFRAVFAERGCSLIRISHSFARQPRVTVVKSTKYSRTRGGKSSPPRAV